MANQDTPFGLKPVQYDPKYIRKRNIDSSNGTILGKHSPVILATDGNVNTMTGQSADFDGVVLELFDSTGQTVLTLAANTAGSARVLEDPNAVYEIQFSDDGTAPTAAAIGDQADLIFTTAVDTNTGMAGCELSETLLGDGNNGQFTIEELVDMPNNTWGHYAKVRVTASEHRSKASVAAI